VPANTYIATILAVSHARLKLVPVEPDIHTYNIDPKEIEKLNLSDPRNYARPPLWPRRRDGTHLGDRAQTRPESDRRCSSGHGAVYIVRSRCTGDAAGFSSTRQESGALGDGGAVRQMMTNLQE